MMLFCTDCGGSIENQPHSSKDGVSSQHALTPDCIKQLHRDWVATTRKCLQIMNHSPGLIEAISKEDSEQAK